MQESELPPHLSPIRSKIAKIEKLARECPTRKIAICLAPILNDTRIDNIILGANGRHELDQILNAVEMIETCPIEIPDDMAINDTSILNPGMWPQENTQ